MDNQRPQITPEERDKVIVKTGVIGIDCNRRATLDAIAESIREAFPEYTVRITPDVDVSD